MVPVLGSPPTSGTPLVISALADHQLPVTTSPAPPDAGGEATPRRGGFPLHTLFSGFQSPGVSPGAGLGWALPASGSTPPPSVALDLLFSPPNHPSPVVALPSPPSPPAAPVWDFEQQQQQHRQQEEQLRQLLHQRQRLPREEYAALVQRMAALPVVHGCRPDPKTATLRADAGVFIYAVYSSDMQRILQTSSTCYDERDQVDADIISGLTDRQTRRIGIERCMTHERLLLLPSGPIE